MFIGPRFLIGFGQTFAASIAPLCVRDILLTVVNAIPSRYRRLNRAYCTDKILMCSTNWKKSRLPPCHRCYLLSVVLECLIAYYLNNVLIAIGVALIYSNQVIIPA